MKEVMVKPSRLDPLTKELLLLAVSVTNNCEYCINSHTFAARKRGMTTRCSPNSMKSSRSQCRQQIGRWACKSRSTSASSPII